MSLRGSGVLRHFLSFNGKMVEDLCSLTSCQHVSFSIQTKGDGWKKMYFIYNSINIYLAEQFWKFKMLHDSIPSKFNLPHCSISLAKWFIIFQGNSFLHSVKLLLIIIAQEHNHSSCWSLPAPFGGRMDRVDMEQQIFAEVLYSFKKSGFSPIKAFLY